MAGGVIICLGPPSPAASSGAWESGRGRWPTAVPGPCSQPGFTEPAPLDAAGALLPHLCTLACARDRPGPSAVCFCGTVLTVTRTGRYPAGLAIGEPGLSSTGRGDGPKAAPHRSRSPRLLSWPTVGRGPRGFIPRGRGGGTCCRTDPAPCRAGSARLPSPGRRRRSPPRTAAT